MQRVCRSSPETKKKEKDKTQNMTKDLEAETVGKPCQIMDAEITDTVGPAEDEQDFLDDDIDGNIHRLRMILLQLGMAHLSVAQGAGIMAECTSEARSALYSGPLEPCWVERRRGSRWEVMDDEYGWGPGYCGG
jgi:hypothetical protein